jgi:Lon protease-like protein
VNLLGTLRKYITEKGNSRYVLIITPVSTLICLLPRSYKAIMTETDNETGTAWLMDYLRRRVEVVTHRSRWTGLDRMVVEWLVRSWSSMQPVTTSEFWLRLERLEEIERHAAEYTTAHRELHNAEKAGDLAGRVHWSNQCDLHLQRLQNAIGS